MKRFIDVTKIIRVFIGTRTDPRKKQVEFSNHSPSMFVGPIANKNLITINEGLKPVVKEKLRVNTENEFLLVHSLFFEQSVFRYRDQFGCFTIQIVLFGTFRLSAC